ncbi:MAG: hypothetical protein QOJ35_3887 [Solirubrobacteraceae bacterium]|jgi:hypothetical protein|nr:hypothetical protein [Solirubrobacteraceae bacterium]
MRIRSAAAGAAALAVGIAGCGGSSSPGASRGGSQTTTVDPNAPEVSPAGDIPDNQAYVAYSPPGGGYSVKVPEGWARTASNGVTSFTDKLNRVQMQAVPARVALTARDARSTEVPKLARRVAGFKAGAVSTVTRHAGMAVRITYEASSPADPVTGRSHTDAVERYVFFHRGRDVVLTLSGPKGADNVDPWKIVTDSLRYTP